MDRDKKSGILLIIIGLCIPIVVMPFTRGLWERNSLYDKLYKSSVPLTKGGAQEKAEGPVATPKGTVISFRLVPQSIPFRFFLAPTVLMLFMGFIRIERARKRARGEEVAGTGDPDPNQE